MNPVLEEIIRTRQTIDPDGKQYPIQWEIMQHEGLLLQRAIKSSGACNAVEIGVAYGISTLFLCEALSETPHARLLSLDPFQTSYYQGRGVYNVKRAGYAEMHTFLEEFSQLALPALLHEGRTFDFVFLDGGHRFDEVFLDFWYVDSMIPPGALVAFHDNHLDSIHAVIRYVLSNRAYTFWDASFPDEEIRGRVLHRVKFQKHLQTIQKTLRNVVKHLRKRLIPLKIGYLLPKLKKPFVAVGLPRQSEANLVILRKEHNSARHPHDYVPF